MSDVYEAIDQRLHRHVALKVFRPGDGAEGNGSSRLLREARAAAALEHPNVVAIYDVGEAEDPPPLRGIPYLAMELVKGKLLRDYIGANVAIDDRVRWLTEIASALIAAHARGLVHRDIKPENVIIREDGTVKVLDFGIAKRLELVPGGPTIGTLSGEGRPLGSPQYMSPEQMQSEPLDGRADQFSWGVVAYELLAGRLPWKAKGDRLRLVHEVLTADPTPLRQVNARVPSHVAAVVMRALSKPRDRRFGSMAELIVALERWVDAFDPTEPYVMVPPLDGTTGKPIIPPPAAPPPAPRSRPFVIAVAGLAAILALAAGIYEIVR